MSENEMHKHEWVINGEYCASLDVECYQQTPSGGMCMASLSIEEAEHRLNCFDELVLSLESALYFIDSHGEQGFIDRHDALDHLAKVLAQAKGGQNG